MSEQTSQEPTMEEILASIRRIISEDEQPAEGAEAPAAEPETAPAAAEAPLPVLDDEPEPVAAAPAPALELEDDDDGDLELTQKVETHGDLDFVAADPEPPAALAAEPAPPFDEPAPAPGANLVSEHVAAAAAATFGQLSSTMLMPAEGRTLEDVVREMLRPMLQQWLDTNLPGIVEAAVQSEVERISRGRR